MSNKAQRIETLANRPGVTGQTVRNYLGSLEISIQSTKALLGHLRYDAYFFQWSAATTEAIRAGIESGM